MYPNSSPEFRIVVKQDGLEELQVRYINITQGYTSKWQAIPKIYESEPIITTP
jgi:predicted metallopeptidase